MSLKEQISFGKVVRPSGDADLEYPSDGNPPVLIDTKALRDFEAEVIDRFVHDACESGGLLVGLPGSRIILDFIPSGSMAARSASSYQTDPEHLQQSFDACHMRHGGEVLGYGHSHPPSSPLPSHQDLAEAGRMLQDPDYPSLTEEVLLPVAQVYCDVGDQGQHIVQMRWFVFDTTGTLSETEAYAIPHWQAVESLADQLREDGFKVEERSLGEDGLALVARRGKEAFAWLLGAHRFGQLLAVSQIACHVPRSRMNEAALRQLAH